jgi:hypothetical protein
VRNVVFTAREEVVYHQDFIALFEKPLSKVRAQETSSAGDEDFFGTNGIDGGGILNHGVFQENNGVKLLNTVMSVHGFKGAKKIEYPHDGGISQLAER